MLTAGCGRDNNRSGARADGRSRPESLFKLAILGEVYTLATCSIRRTPTGEKQWQLNSQLGVFITVAANDPQPATPSGSCLPHIGGISSGREPTAHSLRSASGPVFLSDAQ